MAKVCYLNSFPSQNDEIFSTLLQKAGIALHKNSIKFIILLDLQANTNRVNRRLNLAAFLNDYELNDENNFDHVRPCHFSPPQPAAAITPCSFYKYI
jgi:hypothetical protein